ncbi:MAG: hypothetical protein ACOY3I_04965 [Verrucomicrobiota bacterium]
MLDYVHEILEDEAEFLPDVLVSPQFRKMMRRGIVNGLQKRIASVIPQRSKDDPKRKKWEALEQVLGSYVHGELLAAEKVAHHLDERMMWMAEHIEDLPAFAVEHFRTLRKVIRRKYGLKIHFSPEESTPEDWEESADIKGTHPSFRNAFKNTVAVYLALEAHAPDRPDYIRAKVKDITFVNGLCMEKIIKGSDLRVSFALDKLLSRKPFHLAAKISLDGLNVNSSSYRKGAKRKIFLDSSGRLSLGDTKKTAHHELLHCDDDCDIRDEQAKAKNEDPSEYYAYHGEKHFDENNLTHAKRGKAFREAAPKFAAHYVSVLNSYPRKEVDL